jgi:hypothetical protein
MLRECHTQKPVNAMHVQYGLALEQPTAMATAWVIMKPAVMETDYHADEMFFVSKKIVIKL